MDCEGVDTKPIAKSETQPLGTDKATFEDVCESVCHQESGMIMNGGFGLMARK